MKNKPLTLSLLALLFLFATQTFAATFVVNDGGDAGDTICDVTCTLRDAVDESNFSPDNDSITFAVGLTSITLSNEIVIDNNGTLTITGSGANLLTIDGGVGTNRIFNTTSATVTISGVTLTGGKYDLGNGSAISNSSGSLILDSVVVRQNTGSNYEGTVDFGSSGNHAISNSTFSENQNYSCAGFRIGGGTLTVTSSTFSGNQATGFLGGGFCVYGGIVTMRNSTVTGNTASQYIGGIYVEDGSLDLGNTIVAGNVAPSGYPEIYSGGMDGGAVTSSGFNLIGDSAGDSAQTAGPIAFQSSDKVDIDPMLGPLTVANGGTTPTHALLAGSPAIDQGSRFLSVTDQRGLVRPYDDSLVANASGGDGSDIGAFEKQLGPSAAMVTAGGRVTSRYGRGISGARVTITDASGVTRATLSNTFGYYRFTNVMAGESYIFAVSSKRHSFAQSTLFSSIMDATDAINFVSSN